MTIGVIYCTFLYGKRPVTKRRKREKEKKNKRPTTMRRRFAADTYSRFPCEIFENSIAIEVEEEKKNNTVRTQNYNLFAILRRSVLA